MQQFVNTIFIGHSSQYIVDFINQLISGCRSSKFRYIIKYIKSNYGGCGLHYLSGEVRKTVSIDSYVHS